MQFPPSGNKAAWDLMHTSSVLCLLCVIVCLCSVGPVLRVCVCAAITHRESSLVKAQKTIQRRNFQISSVWLFPSQILFVWRSEASRRLNTELTFVLRNKSNPNWSHGSRLLFVSDTLWLRDSSASSSAAVVLARIIDMITAVSLLKKSLQSFLHQKNVDKIRIKLEWHSVERIPSPRSHSPLSYSLAGTSHLNTLYFLHQDSKYSALRNQKSENKRSDGSVKRMWIHVRF